MSRTGTWDVAGMNEWMVEWWLKDEDCFVSTVGVLFPL